MLSNGQSALQARTLRRGLGKKQIALGGQVRRCSVCTRPLKPWFKEEARFCSRSCVAVAHFRANPDCRIHGYCSARTREEREDSRLVFEYVKTNLKRYGQVSEP